jgi:hypothetical protein
MTTKSLKKFTELLNRSEGLSIIPIIAIMVIMSVMGVVFTSIMGGWKISAPMTINSSKAYNLAETAAMFALQDASNRFFSKNASSVPNFPSTSPIGERSSPFIVSSIATSNGTETAEYWIERPFPSGNNTVDLVGGVNRGDNDDDDSSSDDDVVDDDLDDSVANNTLYTIIATGKVFRNGTTVAKRQIKIKATITDNNISPIAPGVHAEGGLRGTGGSGFSIKMDGSAVPDVSFGASNYPTSASPPDSGNRAGVVYQMPADSPPILDADTYKAMAIDQGHYYSANFSPGNNYPNTSYFYDAPINTMPNITFVEGNLSANSKTIYGIFYVKGYIDLNGAHEVHGILIGEGDIDLNGGPFDPDIDGGVIQLGSGGYIKGNGSPVNININNDFFNFMNNTIPDINIVSWQEAVSAN